MKKKVLFLYTEIAEYFLAGIEALSNKNVEIHIVRWPLNNEAPFKFRNLDTVSFYERNKYTNIQLLQLAKEINPDCLIVSGWTDKSYLKIAVFFNHKIPTILTLDNHWEAAIKQQIARLVSPFFIKNKFTHAWVPGKPQSNYAFKLGFKKDKIYTGFYSADTKLYSDFQKEYAKKKNQVLPKKFLFMGRYIKAKGLTTLWDAFIQLQNEEPNDWELICVGTGEEFSERIDHPKIKHLGFTQPSEMGKIIEETSVFILPSIFEPWGVVVHEFAAAGYPLICSDKVGAADTFLESGKNGYSFKSGDVESLKKAMKQFVNLEASEINKMGNISVEKAKSLSPEKWADTVINFLSF